GLAVLGQAGTGEVTAGDALELHHVQLLAHERTAQHLGRDALVVGGAGQVVREVELVEEEHAHRGEHAALVGDGRVQDVVVRGNTVTDDHEQGLVVDFVDFADLACGEVAVRGKFRAHGAQV